jgi:hypothetical protein
MSGVIFRYTIPPEVPLEDVEAALVLASFAVESLHGEALVQLDGGHALDPARRVCVVDAATGVGRDLNAIFIGFLRRQFGPSAVRLERLTAWPEPRLDAARAGA